MKLERYSFSVSETFLEYKFCSEGPKGKVEKRVRFEQISAKPKVYNLAFGDLDIATGLIK